MAHWEEALRATQDAPERLFRLSGKHLGISQDELDEVAEEKDVWAALNYCQSTPTSDKLKRMKMMMIMWGRPISHK